MPTFSDSSALQSLSTTKVLITDDDEATRILLRAAITPWGYKVIEAKDGEEAWNILKESRPEILILDWLMPKLDGVALCQRINQELNFRPYIIFLTRMTGTENVIQGLEAGADEFMLKPFDLSELRIRIFAGERIIKYRNLLEEQNKKIQFYDGKLAEMTKQSKIPVAEIEKTLEAAMQLLQKMPKNPSLQETEKKLQHIQKLIRSAAPAEKNSVTAAIKKTSSLIDMERMKAFFGEDKNAINEFIKTFITLSSEQVKEIEKAIKQRNPTSAKYFFHLLGSASGNSGIMKMFDLCGKGEAAATKEDWDTAKQCYQLLVDALNQLKKEQE